MAYDFFISYKIQELIICTLYSDCVWESKVSDFFRAHLSLQEGLEQSVFETFRFLMIYICTIILKVSFQEIGSPTTHPHHTHTTHLYSLVLEVPH